MHAGTDRITKLITTRHARALCAYIAYSSLQYHLLGTCSRGRRYCTSVVSASKAVNSAAVRECHVLQYDEGFGAVLL